MKEGLSGKGELWSEGAYLCSVQYQIAGEAGEGEGAFTLTDGVIAVARAEVHDPAVRARLVPHEPLELVLAEPLANGRERLPIGIEPYEGHRPDERFQIRLRD